MENKVLKIGKDTINVVESQGTGQAVILISGNSASSESFFNQLNGTPGKRFRLIAIDMPGHGKSSAADNRAKTYCLPGYASIVNRIIDQRGMERPIVVGHSLGGHIALEASTKLPKAKGLLIFGAPPVGVPPDMANAFLESPAMGSIMKGDLSADEIETWATEMVEDDTVKKSIINAIKATDPNAREYLPKQLPTRQLS